jgi:hypothetical protein
VAPEPEGLATKVFNLRLCLITKGNMHRNKNKRNVTISFILCINSVQAFCFDGISAETLCPSLRLPASILTQCSSPPLVVA